MLCYIFLKDIYTNFNILLTQNNMCLIEIRLFSDIMSLRRITGKLKKKKIIALYNKLQASLLSGVLTFSKYIFTS